MRPKILADEAIVHLDPFADLGDVSTCPAEDFRPSTLQDADVLLVRSVTRVNEQLLGASPVRFVGTVTSGYDHVDVEGLRARGIHVAYAPGCNANAVAEYVVAALLVLAERRGFDPCHMSMGIIGHGYVGRTVHQKADALGIRCVVNDPPLARSTGDTLYRPLEDSLGCDVVSLHVSLELGGPDPTYHLVDADFLNRMKRDAILINTARGPVVDSEALKAVLQTKHLGGCVLDVWENEPDIDTELLQVADIATPHVAGHSIEGKLNGTRMIFEALAEFLDNPASWPTALALPPPAHPEIRIDSNESGLHQAVAAAYDILGEDRTLREAVLSRLMDSEAAFQHVRRHRAVRREFGATRVLLPKPVPELERVLVGLGFSTMAGAMSRTDDTEGAA